MKFVAFHLMPYRPLDLEAAAKYRSAWVVLPNSFYDPEKGAQEYEQYIDFLASAEDLGFYAIGVNEHHSTAYGMMPAPNLIAAALTQRTKKAKIAVLGRALPINDTPLVIAEEYAMLDNLSKGRLIAGFVRGIGAEYHHTGANPYFSHHRFHEAHDLIIQAWTKTGPFPFEGEHYNYRYVNCWPRPYQRPHPPVWIPSQGSTETVVWAAHPDRKYPFLVTFAAAELVQRYHNTYKEQARKYGYEASGDQLGWATPVYVADTDEQAMAEAGRAAETLFNNFLPMPWEMLLPPGYTSMESMKNHFRLRTSLGSRPRNQSAADLVKNGVALIGSVETVKRKIAEMKERTGFNLLVAMCQFGTLATDLAQRNIQRFAAEVMPHFKE